MTVRIDVTAPDDPRGAHVVANAPLVGVAGLTACRLTRVHHVDGALSAADIERFDGLFAGLWFSHVRIDQRCAFLDSIHSVLEPGARVVLLDNSRAQCERLPITYTDEHGNTFQDRETDDGETHRVLKNFPDEEALRGLVTDKAEDVTFHSLDHFWWFSYRLQTE